MPIEVSKYGSDYVAQNKDDAYEPKESQPRQAGKICDKQPAVHIESSVPAVIVVGGLAVAIGAFLYMAWKFNLLRKAIPEFDLE